MLKNYFKIAWRNLIKNKAFSNIYIAGFVFLLFFFFFFCFFCFNLFCFVFFYSKYKKN